MDRREVMYEVEPEEIAEAYHELCATMVDTLVNYGILSSVITQYPDHVQEGYLERIRTLDGRLRNEISEVQEFGEAFDE